MADCQKLYKILFNAITDAMRDMENGNYGLAKEKLKNIQRKTEDIFIRAEE